MDLGASSEHGEPLLGGSCGATKDDGDDGGDGGGGGGAIDDGGDGGGGGGAIKVKAGDVVSTTISSCAREVRY